MAEVTRPYKGLHTDNHPSEQPKDTYRFALNAVDNVNEGLQNSLSNENGIESVNTLSNGYIPVGNCYVTDSKIVIISALRDNSSSEIGILDKGEIYTPLITSAALGIRIENQCDITYRSRSGNKINIYWVDGYNNARQCNLSNLENYYTAAYQTYLDGGGNPNTYAFEKWDATKFELVKTYDSIPTFSGIKILSYGNIDSGSYSASIRLVSSEFDNTEWITTSNPVNIYVDNPVSQFKDIRGSRNRQTETQYFYKANKSIEFTFSNLDTSFLYYQVAIIKSTNNDGIPNQVLVSELIDINDNTYVYSGQDLQMTEISVTEVKLDATKILAPQHIEQLENRLILANGKDSKYNWCEFQPYASKIRTQIKYKNVILNSVDDVANPKNGTSVFLYKGYMPGEVYSMGVVYLMDDYSLSPAFHIPGVNASDVASGMKFYTGTGSYNNIHSCNGVNDYWGKDYYGNDLLGTHVRQHRFPFRSEVSKPLITETNTTLPVTKYRLRFFIDLLPPAAYPGGSINIILHYNLSGLGVQTVVKTITVADMNTNVTIYDDVYVPILMPGSPDYITIDPSSPILLYQAPTVTPSTFTITMGTPISYPGTTTVPNAVTSDIFGFNFSNIQQPPGAIGFYIVRVEKTDDDKLIIDNALMGPTTKFNNYVAFSKFYPDMFTSTNPINPVVNGIQNLINNVGSYSQPQTNDLESAYIYSPEHEYLNKKYQASQVKIEGEYRWTRGYYPYTSPNFLPAATNPIYGSHLTGIKGQLFQTIQVGTKIDLGSTSHSVDLQVGYKFETFSYALTGVAATNVKDIIYLDASDSATRDNKIYFNPSGDNKIGILRFTSPTYGVNIEQTTVYDTDPQYENRIPKSFRLKYVALLSDKPNCYGNFLTRNYYKEHNNPTMFNGSTVNNFEVFNGDAYIGSSNLINSHFWGEVVGNGLGSGTYQIIVGIFALIVGIVATVFGAGNLGKMALSYGVSTLASGIKINKMMDMLDNHYGAGLKQALTDVFTSTLFPSATPNNQTVIQWYSEQCRNIWLESCVNISLRSGLTSSGPDFMNSPIQSAISSVDYNTYINYLMEKLTLLDIETGFGRLYKGYAAAEFYDINLDYLRINKEKIFLHLPIEYDCCNINRNSFNNRVWYSEQSFQEQVRDNYRVFLPNNYRDIESEHGEITDLFRKDNNLFIHTTEGLWELPKNVQEKVTDELISYIGTGEFFSIPPRLMNDSEVGNSGSRHKWATIKTPVGILFINELEGHINLFDNSLKIISNIGNRNYFENNLKGFFTDQFYRLTGGIDYPHYNNPSNPNGVGYVATYDTRHERLLITKKDYLINDNITLTLRDVVGSPEVIMGIPPVLENPQLNYAVNDDRFFIYYDVVLLPGVSFERTPVVIDFTDVEYFINKSFTISYSLINQSWTSWHSYLPYMYMNTPNNLYSFDVLNIGTIFKHNILNVYQVFYNIPYPHIIEFVANINPLENNIWDYVTFKTTAYQYLQNNRDKTEIRNITFDKVTVYNDEQCTGELNMIVKDQESVDYLHNQITNTNQDIIVSRNENLWSFNEIRDYRSLYNVPIFLSDWTSIKDYYFMDKVVNIAAIDFNKNWWELQPFRSNFVVIRLKSTNYYDTQINTQYSSESIQPSIR